MLKVKNMTKEEIISEIAMLEKLASHVPIRLAGRATMKVANLKRILIEIEKGEP